MGTDTYKCFKDIMKIIKYLLYIEIENKSKKYIE